MDLTFIEFIAAADVIVVVGHFFFLFTKSPPTIRRFDAYFRIRLLCCGDDTRAGRVNCWQPFRYRLRFIETSLVGTYTDTSIGIGGYR